MEAEVLLASLRGPQQLEEFSRSLEKVEELAREDGVRFWEAERAREYEDTFLAVIVMKMRFYSLLLAAQHLLIRELRSEREDAVEAVPI